MNLAQRNLSVNDVIDTLQQNLPVVFARKEVSKLLGGLISAGTLANLSTLNCGPAELPAIGRRNTVYERDSFLEWLRTYLEGGIKAVKEQKVQ